MRLVNHRCKFCGADVELKIEEGGFAVFDLEKLKSMAACNRCADFLEKRRTLYQNVNTIYRKWALEMEKAKSDRDEQRIRSGNIAQQMEAIIRHWLATMNAFFRTDIAWDAEIMTPLINGKASPSTILSACERMMRQQTTIPALRVGRASFPLP